MYGEYYISKYCRDELSININDTDVNICEADYTKTMTKNLQMDFITYIYNLCFYIITQFTIVIIGMSADYIEKIWNKNNNKIYFKFSLIFIVGVLICYLVMNTNNNNETCSFPKRCHEGIHDNIAVTNYYYRLESCPTNSYSLPFIYKDKFIEEDEKKCEDSEYGCCKYFNINCIESVEYDYGYEFYNLIKNDNSSWTSTITMKDKNGMNCPSFEEIIYRLNIDYEFNNKEFLSTTFILYIVILIIIIAINCVLNKNNNYSKELQNKSENNVCESV
jgi:hypothetical protein